MSKEQAQFAAPVVKAGTPWSFLAGLAFLILKLTGHIAWAWWIVLLPFYLPFVLFAAFMLVLGVVALVAFLLYLAFKPKK